MSRSLQIVLAGGGTAGHVEPALNLADALRRRMPDVGIVALGTDRGLETTLVPARGYDLELLQAVPMPRRLGRDLLALGPRTRRAARQAQAVLERLDADAVVGFGGYVALPAYLAARRRGVPIVVHEANARAGLANRVGARLTPFVAQAHEGSLAGARLIGIPLRRSIATLDRAAARAEGRRHLGLDHDRPTILVFGGSQGALRLNSAVLQALSAIRSAGIDVVHAVGPRNADTVTVDVGSNSTYVSLPYIDRMDLAYAAADVAIVRGGAMTCAELAAVGLPAAYVPLPIGNGEQALNAAPVVRAGGGLMVDDADLTPEWITAHVIPLAGDSARRAAMSMAAARHGQRDADERLVDMVLEAVAARRPR